MPKKLYLLATATVAVFGAFQVMRGLREKKADREFDRQAIRRWEEETGADNRPRTAA